VAATCSATTGLAITYTAADRAAAVDDFLQSPEAAEAGDPAGRAVLIASQFGTCDLGGADPDEFLAAVSRVVEELWRDDSPATWQAGKSLLAKGHDPHDVIHLLAESRHGRGAERRST
jgi:hypothetical protein